MKWFLLLLVAVLTCSPGTALAMWHSHMDDATVETYEGDPLWWPTKEMLAGWAQEGIDAAGADAPFLKIPGVADWLWTGRTPCGFGDTLEFMVMFSPQLHATAIGYAAAWKKATWERIQAGEPVAEEIAGRLWQENAEPKLTILAGVRRGDGEVAAAIAERQWAAVGYQGQWHTVGMGGGPSLERAVIHLKAVEYERDFTPSYVLSQLMYQVEEPWDVSVLRLEWGRRPDRGVWGEFADAIGDVPEGIRVVVGRPEEYAFVDF